MTWNDLFRIDSVLTVTFHGWIGEGPTHFGLQASPAPVSNITRSPELDSYQEVDCWFDSLRAVLFWSLWWTNTNGCFFFVEMVCKGGSFSGHGFGSTWLFRMYLPEKGVRPSRCLKEIALGAVWCAGGYLPFELCRILGTLRILSLSLSTISTDMIFFWVLCVFMWHKDMVACS